VNPRAEAFERLGGAYDVRVLEPSPPAVNRPPWFADDPTARGVVPPGRQLVSPVTTGDLLWDDLAASDPALADWCADRWLGPLRRLDRVPPNLTETRQGLHALARRVIGPVRERANEQCGLRWTRGGFGTPFFGADAQVRVEYGDLVVQSRFRERRGRIGMLADAAELIGFDLNGETEVEAAPLTIDPFAARFIGEFLGFSTNVLEQLRADVPAEYEPSRLELWPSTFDLMVEVGMEHAGRRAAFGASLGDRHHDEPYLYVAPWSKPEPAPEWNAVGFNGAEAPWTDEAGALAFFRARRDALCRPSTAS